MAQRRDEVAPHQGLLFETEQALLQRRTAGKNGNQRLGIYSKSSSVELRYGTCRSRLKTYQKRKPDEAFPSDQAYLHAFPVGKNT